MEADTSTSRAGKEHGEREGAGEGAGLSPSENCAFASVRGGLTQGRAELSALAGVTGAGVGFKQTSCSGEQDAQLRDSLGRGDGCA